MALITQPTGDSFADKLEHFYATETERALSQMTRLLDGYREVADFGSYHYALNTYEQLRHAACHTHASLYARKLLLERVLTQLRCLSIELEQQTDDQPTSREPLPA